ncbi:HAD family hydrolase [Bacillus licheniformis]|nr:HAD family hydrolase [Bacillus licheniformis]
MDFIPLRTGKPYIVDFILDKFAIERENSFAFGDSGNDVDMLKKPDMVIWWGMRQQKPSRSIPV